MGDGLSPAREARGQELGLERMPVGDLDGPRARRREGNLAAAHGALRAGAMVLWRTGWDSHVHGRRSRLVRGARGLARGPSHERRGGCRMPERGHGLTGHGARCHRILRLPEFANAARRGESLQGNRDRERKGEQQPQKRHLANLRRRRCRTCRTGLMNFASRPKRARVGAPVATAEPRAARRRAAAARCPPPRPSSGSSPKPRSWARAATQSTGRGRQRRAGCPARCKGRRT